MNSKLFILIGVGITVTTIIILYLIIPFLKDSEVTDIPEDNLSEEPTESETESETRNNYLSESFDDTNANGALCRQAPAGQFVQFCPSTDIQGFTMVYDITFEDAKDCWYNAHCDHEFLVRDKRFEPSWNPDYDG